MVNSSMHQIYGKCLKLLIVEDNPGDVILLREHLKISGEEFEYKNAHSLNEAVDILKTEYYDLILLDLGLPESSGFETIKRFFQNNIIQPVIVMTGLDDEELALAALREGAQDYIVKNNFSPETILRSIKYSIERKKLELLQKKNAHQLTILSQTTAALHDGDDISSIYALVCDSIRRLVRGTIVLSIEFDNFKTYHLANTEQLSAWDDQIMKIIEMELYGRKFDLGDQNENLLGLFKDGKLHQVLGGLSKILGSRVPENKCRQVEVLIGIKSTYAIGFLRNDIYYGGIIIFSAERIEDDDKKFIENICGQASLSIHRRIVQKNLVKSEAKYQKFAEELEEKVKERTSELELANIQLRRSETQLRELNATKDKFFNIVAHDLKNPFTSLLGATELLFNNIQNMDKDKIRKLAQILNDSAKSGYAILLNLLDWSRSQTGTIKIHLQMVNLKQIIDDNISELHLNSLDKEILMGSDLRDDLNIIADKNMLNTVLRNLLSNAIKFTPRGGRVLISGEVSQNVVVVSVKDNGIGISHENIDKLFRIDSKFSCPGTEKELGTGLGLKLSKEFVEKLGGRIWVESSENKGSIFTFTIPLQNASVIAK